MRQAEWNDITWGNSPTSLVHIKSLELSQEINVEDQKSNSGQSKKVIKGLNSEELTIQYTTAFAIGVDPRGEFDMLKKCAGKQDDFVLNGNIIGQDQFELDEVELSNTVLDDFGRILKGDITLKFNTAKAPSNKGGKGKAKRKKKEKGAQDKKGKKGGSSGGKKKHSLTLNPADIEKAKKM